MNKQRFLVDTGLVTVLPAESASRKVNLIHEPDSVRMKEASQLSRLPFTLKNAARRHSRCFLLGSLQSFCHWYGAVLCTKHLCVLVMGGHMAEF